MPNAARSTVKTIFEELRLELIERYRPGDLLPNERLLAERFSVSRNTIREVVIFLEAYGLIEKTQRGPRVRAPDAESMFRIVSQVFDRDPAVYRDVLHFRRLIEIGLLPEVLDHITDDEIAALERHAADLDSRPTTRERAEADFRFHAAIVEASRNVMITKLYKAMAQPLIFYLEVGKSNRGIGPATINHHRRIVAALRQRSYRKLLEACEAHFSFSAQVLDQETGERAAPLDEKESRP
ncbi:FadR/GntR family transcriptional regulator [Roseospira visakhapatnamensis]|uniref:DNA-binding FadR family transcriptional regulator n=1 Tax=Roseospira visakhapatnamensis TaxID=390880 RepID=A0A7W6W9T8_9PROT|nr:FCD domain-containing protein [Roseospira visakhapatnamensis]MBB4265791.1 DNA-binding FadR family transcriptional regulator [Roseospira visakhapatnamensis]